jgi:hypothetical protein
VTAPVTVFGDGVAAIANRLRTDLRARGKAATVGSETPKNRKPGKPPTPLIIVSQDGPGSVQQRANSRITVRLAVWHFTKDDAYDLAALAFGLVSTYSGPVVRSVRPGLSPYATTDPDTDEPMAWCTVTANLAPRVV